MIQFALSRGNAPGSPCLEWARQLIVSKLMQSAPSIDHAPASASLEQMGEDPRVARILARSFFRDMKASGVPQTRILEVASELIGLVTSDLSAANDRT